MTGPAALRRAAYADQTAAGPSFLAADTFTRANAATLGTSSSGHLWDEYGTAWAVDGNRARPPVFAGYRLAAMNAGAADVDIVVNVTPAVFAASVPDLGISARAIDINNFLLFDVVYETDHWLCRVFKREGGAFSGITTLVNPVPSMSSSSTAPFVARLVAKGAGGEAFLNGVSVGTWSGLASPFLTPTWHGLAANDANGSGFEDITISAAP